jgi:RHH-type proline utilization regulon transcriptional repressor/proline dehydrogenase/delta 1-pyrroline-5-carboxylate dehydrogenase
MDQFAKNSLGHFYKNSHVLTGEQFQVFSNSDPEILVGSITYATKEDTIQAVTQAHLTFEQGGWSKIPWAERAAVLLKAARLLHMKRNQIASLIVYEAGKSISEALGDVDEAIDFLAFYAREEGKLHQKNQNLKPRGVVAVVSPWNFPLAIPCGMVSSALVAGNCVILKSARPTPLVAQKLADILHQAGVPQGAMIHLPGKGSVVGEELVNNNLVAGIVFTGSKQVGMRMAHQAQLRAVEHSDLAQALPVRVIAEMGGKNAVIVTANAELDEVVSGVLYSAFGHSGQKCSAASRILVDQRVKDKLIERLKNACLDLKVGKAFDFSSSMNPIISEAERNRLVSDAKMASQEAMRFKGVVHVDRSQEDLPGYCVGPVLIELPASRVLNHDSYAFKELFGPIIHVIAFEHLDQALELFNGTEYALTGGIFAQSQDDIDFLSKRMEVGNIYVNRGITGARVGIEPFGGFKLSGTGPKAGGVDYVSAFHVLPMNLPAEKDKIQAVPMCGEGKNDEFDLCIPFKGTSLEHFKAFQSGMKKVVINFENIFGGIYGDQKKVLVDYQKWSKRSLHNFLSEGVKSRVIPGQLGHYDFAHREEQVVILAYEPRPYFASFMDFIVPLSMGMGVSVLARNEKSYNWWSLQKSFFATYFQKGSFDVFYPSKDVLQKVLKNPHLRTVVVDGGKEQMEEAARLVFDQNFNELVMKQLLGPLDAPDVTHFKALVKQFVYIRSFAVNIMRHGAPMELE